MANNTKPTIKQKKAIKNVVENGGNVSKAMRDAGYSPATAKNPSKLTDTAAWAELMETYLPDVDLAAKHKSLLNATQICHLTFITGPRNEKEREVYIQDARNKADKKGIEYEDVDLLSDDDIKQMFNEVNCKVQRIVHSENARHVYYWALDNATVHKSIDLAYKLKGRMTAKVDLTTDGESINQVNRLSDSELLELTDG